MAANVVRNSVKSLHSLTLRTLTPYHHPRSFTVASANTAESDTSSADGADTINGDTIYVKAPNKSVSSSATMPMSSITGSIVGRRFYKQVTTRQADDGNGWSVVLDYRTLRTPTKRPLNLPTHSLAKAIAAEWEYQQIDGVRPFTMPLMKLACTALERVPITRPRIIDHLMSKFNQDLVFCRAPKDNDLTRGVYERQVEKIDPLLDWMESEFGYKPVVYNSFFGGKQDEGLAKAFENVLKKADDCELAAIDALTAAAHSLSIAIGIVRGRLDIEEAIELIRLEEDLQVDKWGLVEGGHDVEIADLKLDSLRLNVSSMHGFSNQLIVWGSIVVAIVALVSLVLAAGNK